MKIRTDVPDIMYRNTSGVKPVTTGVSAAKNNTASYNTIDPQLAQAITSRLHTERNLVEALSIAQASQSLLQKAMIISSQLRSIATQAVVEGKVNSSELEVVLSDMNNSFSAYNKGMTGPVQAFVQGKTNLAELPGVDDAIGNVATMAQGMARGEVPPVHTIDKTMQGIASRMDLYANSITDYARVLRDSVIPETRVAPTGMNPGNVITSRAGDALMAQGNLNPESVYRLLS